MDIRPILNSKRPWISFEVFPPKTPEGLSALRNNLRALSSFQPTFISVTMGAMGTDPGNTFQIVQEIEKELQIPAVAHLTCVNASRERIVELLGPLEQMKIENLLCLRGDPPQGAASFSPPANGFRYASELVRFVREQTGSRFSIGVAGYPEGHLESANRQQDLLHLKAKVDAGADYVLTQLFFQNDDYFDFVKRARGLGIQIPIIPGIMPVTNVAQLKRFTQVCGASIPQAMHQALEPIQNEPEKVRDYGVQYAIAQCRGLLKQGVPGIHFYILNQTESIQRILKGISPLLED